MESWFGNAFFPLGTWGYSAMGKFMKIGWTQRATKWLGLRISLIEAQLYLTESIVLIQNLWETGRPILTPRALTVLHGMTIFFQNQCVSSQTLAVIGGSHPKPNIERVIHKSLYWIVDDLMMKDLSMLNQSAKFVEMLLFSMLISYISLLPWLVQSMYVGPTDMQPAGTEAGRTVLP